MRKFALACDRAVVIFNGRVVDVIDAEDADDQTLLHAAYGLSRSRGGGVNELCPENMHGCRAGCWLLVFVLLAITKLIQPSFGASGLESIARAALPFAFATAGMAVVVIVGGIDLSVASMMAVCAVTAAVLMEKMSGVPAMMMLCSRLGWRWG